MICIIALVVFGILGIFSASHRQLAKEAFDCVFRRITLRKCTTGLDVRLKSHITSKFLEKSPKAGAFVYRYFELLSWFFTILMIASIIWTGISAYNYYIYGNCNGASLEDQEKTCLFDPHGENSQISTADNNATSDNITISDAPPTIDGVNLSLFPAYQGKSIKDEMVYVGCYACPNTKKVNPEINQLVGENRDTLKLTFIHLPLHKEYEYLLNIENCLYQKDKVAYWNFHQKMMELPKEEVQDKEKAFALLSQIKGENSKKINVSEILECSESKEAQELSEKQLEEIHKMNIKGTPTIFVNGEVFIGPKPMRVYEMQLSTYVNWFSISLFSLLGIIIAILLYYIIFKRE